MTCDAEKQRLEQAEQAYNTAMQVTMAAKSSLESAAWALAAAYGGMVVCALTVETVVGFALCEALATAAVESAEAAVAAAEISLSIAEQQEASALVAFLDAVDALVKCCESKRPAVPA